MYLRGLFLTGGEERKRNMMGGREGRKMEGMGRKCEGKGKGIRVPHLFIL